MPDDLIVLIVEDEGLMLEFAASRFREAGWQVLKAISGEAALALLSNGTPVDVLLTDISLRGRLNGWDMGEASRERHPELPVVYVSGNAVDLVRKVPGSLFFKKPYNIDAVVDACRELTSPGDQLPA